jgi:hypothetical protein
MIFGRIFREGGPGNPDPVAFFERLKVLQFGDGYDDADRYRDFRRVFLGTREGRRCLYQIFEWAHVFHNSVVPGDPYMTHFQDGERSIGLQILSVLNAEPAGEPGLRVEFEETP